MTNENITSQIKIKARPSDKKRWQDAAERNGRTLSDICRAALDRFAARVEKADKQ